MHRDPRPKRPRQNPLHVALALIVVCLILSPWGIACYKLGLALADVAIELFHHYYPQA